MILSLVAPGGPEWATPALRSRNQALTEKATGHTVWPQRWQWLGEGRYRGEVTQQCCGVARALQRGGILWAGLVREGFLEEAGSVRGPEE